MFKMLKDIFFRKRIFETQKGCFIDLSKMAACVKLSDDNYCLRIEGMDFYVTHKEYKILLKEMVMHSPHAF